MFTKGEEKWLVATLIALLIISLILTPLTKLTFLESIKTVFGAVFLLFLPGYLITYIFIKKNDIDHIERIALGFALSIAIVPLLMFCLNLVGLKINLISSTLVVSIIILITIIILLKNKNEKTRKKKN